MASKKDYLKLTAAPILWGGALVAGRAVSPYLPPLTTAFVRFFLAALFMLPVLYRREKRFPKPTRRDWMLILLLSLTGVVCFNFFLFTGLQTVDAGRSGVIIALTPAVVVLLAGVFLQERLSPVMIAGAVLACAGALVTVSSGDVFSIISNPMATGDAWIFAAVVSWALYTLVGKQAMGSLSALTVLTYSFTAGTLMLLPVTLANGSLQMLSRLPISGWISILYLSFGSAGIAYLWYYEGIKAVGPSRASIFMNLEPAAAILFGALLLGELVSPSLLFGTILVLCGVYLTTGAVQKKPDRSDPA